MNAADEPTFTAPWQARAFALTLNLHDRGLFTWTEWSDTLAHEIEADPCRDYYNSWLAALEAVAIRHDALTADEIEQTQAAWLDAAADTPHGETITLKAE
jgi:nitrile hydratase accessory protein